MKFHGINPASCTKVGHGSSNDWLHLHAAGCADIARYSESGQKKAGFQVAGNNIEEAIRDLCSDFIDGGEMTYEDCLADVVVFPCCHKVK